jgi:hypothetical protein
MTNGTKTNGNAKTFTDLESDVYALLDMTREAMDALGENADRNDGANFDPLHNARTYLVNALAELSGKNHDAIVEALEATHDNG